MKKIDEDLKPSKLDIKLESKSETCYICLAYFVCVIGIIASIIGLIISYS